MATYAHDSFSVYQNVVGPLPADDINQIQLVNSSGGTLYYKNASSVTSSSNDGNLTAGQTVTLSTTTWVVSTTVVNVILNYLPGAAFGGDVTVADDLTVTDVFTASGTSTLTGITTLTGGIGATATKARALPAYTYPPQADTTLASTSTTDTASASNKAIYMASLFVPVNCTVTGIAVLNGTNVTTDKFVNYIINAAGTVLGSTAILGTVPNPADTYQETDLTTPLVIRGPAVYFIGRQHNGTTITLQKMLAAKGVYNLAGTVAGTSFGAETSVVPPTTFTADMGPFGYLY